MALEKKKFSEIKHYELPEYFKNHIPDDADIYEISYFHGELIGDYSGFKDIPKMTKTLGIMVSGEAEIYETYIANTYRVYRPIRLIRTGDLLGDFSLLDHICCEQDKLNSTRRGETWEICAGFKSVLVKSKVTNNVVTSHFKETLNEIDRVGYPYLKITSQHLITHNSLKNNQVAKIVFFNPDFIVDADSPILHRLFLYSWPRSKMYRDCLNSFNFRQLQNYRQIATTKQRLLFSSSNGFKYDNKVDKKIYMSLFIDAVWDTCNRPIRGEPMFVEASSEVLGDAENKFKEIGLSANDILVASSDLTDKEFFFPIDINNYSIASNFDVKNYRGDKDDIDKQLMKILLPMNAGRNDQNNRSVLNAKTFYIHFCEELLKVIKDDKYPFEVSCIETNGLENNMLLLHFTKKTVNFE